MLRRLYVGETTLFWNGIVKLQFFFHPKAAQPPGMQREVSFILSHCNSVKML